MPENPRYDPAAIPPGPLEQAPPKRASADPGREPTTDDVWAAVRGLQMWSATETELDDLILAHQGAPLHAGKAICRAAREVKAARFTNRRRR